MKRILSLFAGAVLCATAIAQHGPMAFVGPSRFGVESMNAWQDNESDVVFLQVNGATDADITLPKMVYAAMNMTLPSFTIHGATFTYDMESRSVVFDEQTYSETIVVDDVEKAITGSSLTATYSHSDNTLSLTTRFSYGSMPMEITYIIENAVYDSSVTGIEEMNAPQQCKQVFDLNGLGSRISGRAMISPSRFSSFGKNALIDSNFWQKIWRETKLYISLQRSFLLLGLKA